LATVPFIGLACAVPFGPALLISVALGGVVAPAAGAALSASGSSPPTTFGSLIADNP
jgi:hypothetical protein